MAGRHREYSQAQQLAELLHSLRRFGPTDEHYLTQHFARFLRTRDEFVRTRPAFETLRVLDIGAHWLHQSVLWARDGHAVTAVDLPTTFALDSVRALAASSGIALLTCDDLENCAAFASLPDASIDVILFTEILEHLTFNPVPMWRQLHRVLGPGGTIVVTTPNYYRIRSRAWHPWRFLTGDGGGLSVDEILRTPTHGHHWREFSLREVVHYFRALSPDFSVAKAMHVTENDPAQHRSLWLRGVEAMCPWLREGLHLEIVLAQPRQGIRVEPRWH